VKDESPNPTVVQNRIIRGLQACLSYSPPQRARPPFPSEVMREGGDLDRPGLYTEVIGKP
jgi:hypothetical protein